MITIFDALVVWFLSRFHSKAVDYIKNKLVRDIDYTLSMPAVSMLLATLTVTSMVLKMNFDMIISGDYRKYAQCISIHAPTLIMCPFIYNLDGSKIAVVFCIADTVTTILIILNGVIWALQTEVSLGSFLALYAWSVLSCVGTEIFSTMEQQQQVHSQQAQHHQVIG